MFDNRGKGCMLPCGKVPVNCAHGFYDDMADFGMVRENDVIHLIFLFGSVMFAMVASHDNPPYISGLRAVSFNVKSQLCFLCILTAQFNCDIMNKKRSDAYER